VEPVNLTFSSLIFAIMLLLFVAVVLRIARLGLVKTLIISASRMIIQLLLVGVFLNYIFELNNPILNGFWFLTMLTVAVIATVSNSKLSLRHMYIPIFLAIFISSSLVLLYFNYFIIGLSDLFDARYLIAIGGMLLGNSLKANIVGLQSFYSTLRREKEKYYYYLSAGATRYEALSPFLRKSLELSIKPTLATMATVGIVALPGMMTGQILSGIYPILAVKYQIAIMIAILTVIVFSVWLSIMFSVRYAIDDAGRIKEVALKNNY
jgi:putative ABC transport system permease protein